MYRMLSRDFPTTAWGEEREREKFVRPLNFLEERAQAASPSMVPVFIFPFPPCTCVDDGMVGRGFSGDRTRKVALW
jgi:hypothetical protein